MPTLTYPSAEFPGPPSVDLDIPGDWAPVRVPGTLLAARHRDAEDRFAPSIVVRGLTRESEFTLTSAVAELRDSIQARPDGTVEEPFTVDLGGVPFLGVNCSFHDDSAGSVVQTHLFTAARRPGVVDLVQVTGSLAGEHVGHRYGALQAVMQTVRVTR